jgi:O-acetyl-ADP-ribose deacetylase (regulator of RNase III)
MCTLEARFFPEQSQDAVLFWDPSVLSELLRIKVVSSTIHSGHTHLLRFESEAATEKVLHDVNNMRVGEGVELQLRRFGKSSPIASSHPSSQTDIRDGSTIVFLYRGASEVRIVVDQADVNNLPVDSLVYSADQSFSFDGGLAKHIAQTAGPEFSREVQSKIKPPNSIPAIGQAMITGSGQLASTRIKSIVHAIIPHFSNPDRDHLMEHAVRSALRLATNKGAFAAGITVMGSGQFKWPVEAAAETLVRSILASFRDGVLAGLREVRIFDRDAAKIAAVLNYIRTQCASDLVPAAAHPPLPAVRCSLCAQARAVSRPPSSPCRGPCLRLSLLPGPSPTPPPGTQSACARHPRLPRRRTYRRACRALRATGAPCSRSGTVQSAKGAGTARHGHGERGTRDATMAVP